MANLPAENYTICENCGRPYLNFCVNCAKQFREELVESLMDQYGLEIEKLVSNLADEVKDKNFGALKLAIEMRSMKPATKTDVTSGGQALFNDPNVKSRLADKITRVLNRRAED